MTAKEALKLACTPPSPQLIQGFVDNIYSQIAKEAGRHHLDMKCELDEDASPHWHAIAVILTKQGYAVFGPSGISPNTLRISWCPTEASRDESNVLSPEPKPDTPAS